MTPVPTIEPPVLDSEQSARAAAVKVAREVLATRKPGPVLGTAGLALDDRFTVVDLVNLGEWVLHGSIICPDGAAYDRAIEEEVVPLPRPPSSWDLPVTHAQIEGIIDEALNNHAAALHSKDWQAVQVRLAADDGKVMVSLDDLDLLVQLCQHALDPDVDEPHRGRARAAVIRTIAAVEAVNR